jgi:predicted esterase
MDIKTDYIKVEKTARYSTWGNPSAKTKFFWFVLHGSNMICEQVLYKFADFDPDTHFIVAPEGLSRFYKDGNFSGDVVAAWMTKRDRLKEISDFSNYLSSLYKQELSHLPKTVKKIVMGFSQGGTTAYRWLHNSPVDIDFLLGYSCWIPEDIDFGSSQTNLDAINKIYTYGDSDRFLTEERIAVLKDIIKTQKLEQTISIFKGIHRIEKQHLLFLFNTYIKENN